MRTAVIFASCLTVSLSGVATMSHQLKEQRRPKRQQLSVFESEESRTLLEEFIATLDPEIMKACAQQHDLGQEVDLDSLATCGDFDLYARYVGISKLEAVKRFRAALLQSSSRIEFEDKLAR